MPCRTETPAWLRGEFDTLAVRVIDHPVATPLCRLFGGPVVSTSANVSGLPPALDAEAVKQQFPAGLDLILEGTAGATGLTSTIRDARTQQQIR